MIWIGLKDLEREDYYLNIHHNASLYFDGLTNGFLKCETLKMKTCELINRVFLQRIYIIFGYSPKKQNSHIDIFKFCINECGQTNQFVLFGGREWGSLNFDLLPLGFYSVYRQMNQRTRLFQDIGQWISRKKKMF